MSYLRISIDDKPPPSWADAETWRLYEEVGDLSRELHFTGMACGWANQPTPHGELTLSTKAGPNALRFSAPHPAETVRMAHAFLSRIEKETRP